MTTIDDYGTPAIDFDAVSAPIEGETLATVESVAHDWMADRSWRLFVGACEYVAEHNSGLVVPDEVRADLTQTDGELCIRPRRLSAFYNRAVAQGLLEFSHWGINGDHKGRNAGRPARVYRLIRTAA